MDIAQQMKSDKSQKQAVGETSEQSAIRLLTQSSLPQVILKITTTLRQALKENYRSRNEARFPRSWSKRISSRMSGCDGTSFACEEPEVQECAGSHSKSEVGPEPRKRGPPTQRDFTSALFLTNILWRFIAKYIDRTIDILRVEILASTKW